ncbi:MAG: T9SS C-terminal target domain-containing protein, partial [Bacteroidetes bacterium]
YAYVAYPPEGAVGLEARLRYWHQFQGNTFWDDVAIIPLGGSTLVETGTEDEMAGNEVPETFQLYQNFPNPFNPTTTIAFDLPQQARVNLAVYDLLGRRVALLLEDQILPAGTRQVRFDAKHLPSGVYLYVLEVNSHRKARQMVLLK